MAALPCREYGATVTSGARLTVLGSLNMDISVTVDRLPAPGATVLGGAAAFAPGGKGANQAVAAARLGGAAVTVRMAGCVGDDDFGRALRAALRAEGVDDSAVRAVPGAPTGIAMITVDAAGENTITVAPGANREAGQAEVAAAGATADVLVISAEVPVTAIRAAMAAGTESSPALRLLNLAPAPPEAAELVAAAPDWLVVNESEAAAILGRPVRGLDEAARAAADLVTAGARNAVVTAGAAGVAYCGPGTDQATADADAAPAAPAPADPAPADPAPAAPADADPAPADATLGRGAAAVAIPGFPVRAVDSVGAGDTFVGALAVALASGIEPHTAVTAAAAAGATAATRPGTQSGMPRPADIAAATGFLWPVPHKH
jgi:ribokinase